MRLFKRNSFSLLKYSSTSKPFSYFFVYFMRIKCTRTVTGSKVVAILEFKISNKAGWITFKHEHIPNYSFITLVSSNCQTSSVNNTVDPTTSYEACLNNNKKI